MAVEIFSYVIRWISLCMKMGMRTRSPRVPWLFLHSEKWSVASLQFTVFPSAFLYINPFSFSIPTARHTLFFFPFFSSSCRSSLWLRWLPGKRRVVVWMAILQIRLGPSSMLPRKKGQTSSPLLVLFWLPWPPFYWVMVSPDGCFVLGWVLQGICLVFVFQGSKYCNLHN